MRKRKIIRMYLQGYSPLQIEAELKGEITAEGIRQMIQREGVPLRGRSEAKTRKDLPDTEILRQLYEDEKLSCYAIGQKLSISPATVYLRLKRAGVPLRDMTQALVLRDGKGNKE